ncbi:S8 family serine peptidase [Moheibacter stercoris]|uniref:Peptidase S8/S53 domain-containing protein n=1 Tax=Moheibacter stercoris TaxID=1628251 RepID=A0ABV2LUU7_9FLAO
MFLATLGTFVFAQNQYSYYVVENVDHSLEPQSKTTNSNGTLNLSFANSSLNSFFQGKIIFEYEKAFPLSSSAYLQRVYLVKTNTDNDVTSFSNRLEIEYAEKVPIEELMLEPNDFYYVEGGQAKTQLTLVRANKAWDITIGNNPLIIVGIADTKYEDNHEDLVGKAVSFVPGTVLNIEHETSVAGTVSANTNNNDGIAGIGYNTKLAISQTYSVQKLYELAEIPNVRILNASWGGCTYSPINAEAYKDLRLNKNVLVVASAGNGSCGDSNNYVYPASYDYVLSVSSVGHTNPVDYYDPVYGAFSWRDVHQNVIDPLNPEESTHQHNDKVDIVAPGYHIRILKDNNQYGTAWGTSYSSPMVAGAAALVLSVKPSLTPNQVENILKSTADDIFWIPYNQPYIGKLGSGRLNVFRAVKTVECLDEDNPKLNLVVRDTETDLGNEPNNISTYYWNSQDIWVRNQDDGRYNEVHQSVEYSATQPNFVYVRVTNYDCQNSSGEDELKLYWSYAGTAQSWPTAWDGSLGTPSNPSGGLIGTLNIPQLGPGQETILKFEWFPPNPANYPGAISLSGNFGLLARIISDDDPINYINGLNITNYVKNNNNVAWKNFNIVDLIDSPITSASFMIANLTEETKTYSLELNEENAAYQKSIYEEAEVRIVMDEFLHSKWLAGGSSIFDADPTRDTYSKHISGNNPKLSNITLAPGESGTVEITFNFLTKELIDKQLYEYNIIQKDVSNSEIIGGATIQIIKENRNDVLADAEVIENSNSSTIIAENINESATYNWYDSEGNLIHSGTELTVSPEIAKTYKLEIISDLDGLKDYKEIEVIGNNPYSLGTIIPNPVSSQVTISYDASSASSAYLMITNTITSGSENYILNTTNNQINLNLSNYSSGIFTVTLICNDAIVDSKNIIKN